ncbi:MAG: FG-GAP-like repeat-containing protein [Planctomycetota bacterium]|jgi:Tfp pilus assembly protein PilF
MTRQEAATATKRPIGRRRRRLRKAIVILSAVGVAGLAGGVVYWSMSRPETYRPGEDLPEITRKLASDLPEHAPDIRLADVTAEAGLKGFRSFAGPRSSQLPEDMGSGAAWGDYDRDGDDDLFLVSNGGSLEAEPARWPPCELYENRGDGTFEKVRDFPELRIIGMAAAWGDADGDGWLDLVVTGYRSLTLFRNEQGSLVRDETFTAPEGYWAGASWGDYDRDRRLDLYVCGYVRYREDDPDRARASLQFGTPVPYTLNPSSYEPQPNLLFHNEGAGAFREVAEAMGVANPEGRSLNAIWHDFDEDGWLDLYVANDVSDNVLYRNLGDGFAEISHAAWVADYRGAMGLAVGDYNRDGDDDIFVTHWIAQENALYDSLQADLRDRPPSASGDESRHPHAPENLRFMDLADMKGLGQIALQKVGWGAEFADFDGDGWLDLAVTNGSTFQTADDPPRLKPQLSFLFWNDGGRRFHDLATGSDVFSVPRVSRGLAVSDYDGDGDQDIILVNHAEGVQLLRNDMQTGNWIQLRLRSRNHDGHLTGFGDGAMIVAHVGDAVMRRSVSSTSYLSQSSTMVHLGLGAAASVDRLEVRWIGGGTDVYENLSAGGLWEIREGEATPRRLFRTAAMTGKERIVAFWSKHRAAMRAMKVEADYPKAIALFEEAVALDPTHEDARYYLGNCLAAVGDTDAAVVQLEALLRLDPRSHRGLRRLGVLRASVAKTRADLKEAMSLLDRALEINREETGVLLAMGEIDLILGDYDQADQHLEWACRTNPRAVSGFYLRGYVAWKRGEDDMARELLQRARDALGPEWKPEGTTAEGDVATQMHAEATPLSAIWMNWDGSLDPAGAFAVLDAHLESHPAG